jgi:glucosamine-6-phosphate deaminase
MVRGPITTLCPASFLQLHRDVEIWLDAAAGRGLEATR